MITWITVLTMISINVTGIARDIARIILNFSQFDILPSEIIFSYLFTFDEINDTPVNDFFSESGYVLIDTFLI